MRMMMVMGMVTWSRWSNFSFDNDLIADCVDPDDDNDGCLDEEDPWPYNENASDTDGMA